MLTAAFVNPVAFELGPFPVRWYGLIIVSAILLAVWLATKSARYLGLDPEFVPDLATVLVPSGILGARLYEVFVLQWDYFREHPGEILAIWEGGLAIHGAVLGAVLCGAIFMRYRRQPFWPWADVVAPVLILAQGIGRWGNFFNQEAFGSPAPESVINLLPAFIREGMTINGVVMHPTFLYESIWNVASFGILYMLQRRKPPTGTVFSLYLILYNTGRFLIESIREDSSFILGGIRTAQAVAAGLVLLGLALLVWHLRRARAKQLS